MNRSLALIILSLVLISCDSGVHYAPVIDINIRQKTPIKGVTHVVKPGETLYAIAWRYGMDYNTLATLNHIASPYTIFNGQEIKLLSKSKQPQKKLTASSVKWAQINKDSTDPIHWFWPVKKDHRSNVSSVNQGVQIVGKLGTPIYATATGKVVYCGDGLRGYGNLIILKHNRLYLSAYAHNQQILVREGQAVKAGQKIAEMGNTDAPKPLLYFEIRYAGKPVNAIKLLGS